ncbi:mitochondrial pyruvate carboxylase [Andalucia godoyi]|uniref:Pyruvate carboxylase n=1 Tax=Andalucia godoyi TaxID=505711 RepID=A0A8K0AGR6_ANDGO|nr:mitochondrial pyruvate carboxylase [Andalucia godoyi]|eukprot:ANDGO_03568.mRNA.1 mitochondrial pyruvate carboxylase
MHSAGRTFKPIRKLMAANRGEIAVRVFKAAHELGIKTVAIFPREDSGSMHTRVADQAFEVSKFRTTSSSATPVAGYLGMDEIIEIAKSESVDAIHPGYGFLSENAEFARKVIDAGITWIGPRPDSIETMGDKVSARSLAVKAGLPVLPGTAEPVQSPEEAMAFCAKHGFPVILKAAFGGGGRGMRIVRSADELKDKFSSAHREAESAFGKGDLFVERFLPHPRHIEVQVVGDAYGNVAHLWDRDCSIQQRHQKVVEIAPAVHLPRSLRERVLGDAVKLAGYAKYENAGTVEFLIDPNTGEHFFMEVNPRLQVEHTITEQVTGVDLVHTQIGIAQGSSLEQLHVNNTQTRGVSIQLRVTSQAMTGTMGHLQLPEGAGIRVDGGSYGYAGADLSAAAHFDPLLFKIIVSGRDLSVATAKAVQALKDTHTDVPTNLPFLGSILQHPQFLSGGLDTNVLDRSPEQFASEEGDRARLKKLMRFLGEKSVHREYPGHYKDPNTIIRPKSPHLSSVAQHRDLQINGRKQKGWRDVLRSEGPNGFAKAVRNHKQLLLMDTTMRDAHQSLLATRVRTHDLLAVAEAQAAAFAPAAYSLETWGGATFDVCLQFLRECPWDRLEQLRERIPHTPMQMLLRGANAVGYTSYPDNVVSKFCDQAVKSGMDVFRVFDSLNYLPNLQLGIEAAGQAGGVVEAALSYTGIRGKYTLEYYAKVAEACVRSGAHVLCIKDMAGLLRPQDVEPLVTALRAVIPASMPIHVHTHDSAGTGVASMLACSAAGVDVVDVAIDSMSGLTSQPSAGALVASLLGTERDTGLELEPLMSISTYWEQLRTLYAPFEVTQSLRSTSADIFINEIPGGQYSNLHFQANSLGLADRWPAVKQAYRDANVLLGDIIKVTPSSKVVGDLAQFMVANHLSPKQVMDKADELSFPSSVVDYLKGGIGIPEGGIPADLQRRVLKGRVKSFDGRPGAEMAALDFAKLATDLELDPAADAKALLSAALYPKEFESFESFKQMFGTDTQNLPTDVFFGGLRIGQTVRVPLSRGKWTEVKLMAIGERNAVSSLREVFFAVDGKPRSVFVHEEEKAVTGSARGGSSAKREKADKKVQGSIAAPMPGKVVRVAAKVGQKVAKGEAMCVLSAMKMETVLSAPREGVVKRVCVSEGDVLEAGDLVLEMESADATGAAPTAQAV